MSDIKNRTKDFKFILNSAEKGEYELEFNPVDWAETEVGFDRDTENDGISFTFSGEYTYIKDGYDYIKDGLNKYGILWICTLTVKAINTHSKQYDTIIDSKKLDFTSRPEKSDENGKTINISLEDSEFHEKLKAYENEEIPYSRLETLYGQPITPYDDEYELVNVLGQELKTTGIGTGTDLGFKSDTNGSSMMLDIIFEGDNDNLKSVLPRNLPTDGSEDRTIKDAFYIAPFGANVNIDFSLDYNWTNQTGGNKNFVYLDIWEYDVNGNLTNLIEIIASNEETVAGTFLNPSQGDYNFSVVAQRTLLYNQCLTLRASQLADPEDLEYIMTTYETSVLNIEMYEKNPPTDINHVLVWNAHDRLATAITGESGSFRSSVFETGGIYADDCLSNGYLYRQFPTIPTVPEIEEEVTAQLSFKWADLVKNTSILREVGYGIITENGKNIIICEKKEYFYQEGLSAIINNYKRGTFTRDIDIEQYISAIDVGTKKKEYESAGALIDYTTKSNHTTILSSEFNALDLVTTFQRSGNWLEKSRRLVYDATKTTDSKFDNDIFILETIDIEGVRTQRTTQDFDTITGIDGITTLVNLNLTNGRIIQRWGKWIKAGLILYPTSVIKFNKSEVLTKLSTVRSDESIEIFENKDINVSTLDPAKFTGDVIDVLADINTNDIANIEANQYQKVQIKDEITGEDVQGWFLTASTKPIGEALTNIRMLESTIVTPIPKNILWNDGDAILWVDQTAIEWNAG